MSDYLKRIVVTGVLCFACTSMIDGRSAEAGWWHGWGCYSPCYSYCYYPSYSYCYYPSYSYCYYPSYSYCYYPSYSYCYYPSYSYCSYPAYYSTWYYPSWDYCQPSWYYSVPKAPATQPAPKAPETQPAPVVPDPGAATRRILPSNPGNSAFIDVSVPADAKIYVNGYLTKKTGEYRRYESKDLKPGKQYTFEIRAERLVDGKTVDETKNITVVAGEKKKLAFTLPTEDNVIATLSSLDN